jgi:hypothetical protein
MAMAMCCRCITAVSVVRQGMQQACRCRLTLIAAMDRRLVAEKTTKDACQRSRVVAHVASYFRAPGDTPSTCQQPDLTPSFHSSGYLSHLLLRHSTRGANSTAMQTQMKQAKAFTGARVQPKVCSTRDHGMQAGNACSV